ncbi:unnamed protein product, partial [Laminaria digitata]
PSLARRPRSNKRRTQPSARLCRSTSSKPTRNRYPCLRSLFLWPSCFGLCLGGSFRTVFRFFGRFVLAKTFFFIYFDKLARVLERLPASAFDSGVSCRNLLCFRWSFLHP